MLIGMFLGLGLVIGALARLLIPGGKEPGGWFAFMLIGVGGGLLGGFVGRAIGRFLPVGEDPARPAGFLMSLLGAVALVGIYVVIAKRHRAVKVDEKPSEIT